MTSPIQTVAGDTAASEIVGRFVQEGIGSLVVTHSESDDIEGIVTESDVIRQVAMGTDMDAVTASAVMSTPVVTIGADEPIATAADEMRTHSIRRLPVVADGNLVGIVTTTDLTHYLPRLRQTLLRERPSA